MRGNGPNSRVESVGVLNIEPTTLYTFEQTKINELPVIIAKEGHFWFKDDFHILHKYLGLQKSWQKSELQALSNFT